MYLNIIPNVCLEVHLYAENLSDFRHLNTNNNLCITFQVFNIFYVLIPKANLFGQTV